MRNNILLLIAAIAAPLLLGWMAGYAKPPRPQQTIPAGSAGEMLPDFEFRDLGGRIHRSADYRGKILLLNFWASWCIPCAHEFPELLKIARERGDLSIVALSVDENAEAAQKFLKRFDILPGNFIVGIDEGQKISHDLFQSILVPETVIVTPAGMMRAKIAGGDWSRAEMDAEINAAR
jgi:thiol-disulfide isomerase/thioredoxin